MSQARKTIYAVFNGLIGLHVTSYTWPVAEKKKLKNKITLAALFYTRWWLIVSLLENAFKVNDESILSSSSTNRRRSYS